MARVTCITTMIVKLQLVVMRASLLINNLSFQVDATLFGLNGERLNTITF